MSGRQHWRQVFLQKKCTRPRTNSTQPLRQSPSFLLLTHDVIVGGTQRSRLRCVKDGKSLDGSIPATLGPNLKVRCFSCNSVRRASESQSKHLSRKNSDRARQSEAELSSPRRGRESLSGPYDLDVPGTRNLPSTSQVSPSDIYESPLFPLNQQHAAGRLKTASNRDFRSTGPSSESQSQADRDDGIAPAFTKIYVNDGHHHEIPGRDGSPEQLWPTNPFRSSKPAAHDPPRLKERKANPRTTFELENGHSWNSSSTISTTQNDSHAAYAHKAHSTSADRQPAASPLPVSAVKAHVPREELLKFFFELSKMLGPKSDNRRIRRHFTRRHWFNASLADTFGEEELKLLDRTLEVVIDKEFDVRGHKAFERRRNCFGTNQLLKIYVDRGLCQPHHWATVLTRPAAAMVKQGYLAGDGKRLPLSKDALVVSLKSAFLLLWDSFAQHYGNVTTNPRDSTQLAGDSGPPRLNLQDAFFDWFPRWPRGVDHALDQQILGGFILMMCCYEHALPKTVTDSPSKLSKRDDPDVSHVRFVATLRSDDAADDFMRRQKAQSSSRLDEAAKALSSFTINSIWMRLVLAKMSLSGQAAARITSRYDQTAKAVQAGDQHLRSAYSFILKKLCRRSNRDGLKSFWSTTVVPLIKCKVWANVPDDWWYFGLHVLWTEYPFNAFERLWNNGSGYQRYMSAELYDQLADVLLSWACRDLEERRFRAWPRVQATNLLATGKTIDTRQRICVMAMRYALCLGSMQSQTHCLAYWLKSYRQSYDHRSHIRSLSRLVLQLGVLSHFELSTPKEIAILLLNAMPYRGDGNLSLDILKSIQDERAPRPEALSQGSQVFVHHLFECSAELRSLVEGCETRTNQKEVLKALLQLLHDIQKLLNIKAEQKNHVDLIEDLTRDVEGEGQKIADIMEQAKLDVERNQHELQGGVTSIYRLEVWDLRPPSRSIKREVV